MSDLITGWSSITDHISNNVWYCIAVYTPGFMILQLIEWWHCETQSYQSTPSRLCLNWNGETIKWLSWFQG